MISMLCYEHRITVQDGTLTPQGPLPCGTAGDHAAARLIFAPLDAAFAYRAEIVTGADTYDITDRLGVTDGELTLPIPSAWTEAGTAALRLVQLEIVDGEEVARCYYPPISLTFDYRDEGHGAAVAAPLWQELLTQSEATLAQLRSEADEASMRAETAADAAAAEADACRAVLSEVEALTDITAAINRTLGVE